MTDGKFLVCPACIARFELTGSKRLDYPFSKRKPELKEFFKAIHFCPQCDLGLAVPAMTDQELDSLYVEGDYWQDRTLKIFYPRHYPGVYANAAARWQYVKGHLGLTPGSGITVLDIGGGHGFLGSVISRDKSVRLERYEIVEKDRHFQESLKWTWKNLYPRVPFKVWSDMGEVSGKCHLIVLSHVLEHLNDPKKILGQALGHLEEGGHIFIDVPCQDYRFKKDVFPHVLFYQAENLSQLCQNAGLCPVAVSCFGIDQDRAQARNSSRYAVLLEKLLYRIRTVVPLFVWVFFYDLIFRPGTANPNGVWIRALVKKEGKMP